MEFISTRRFREIERQRDDANRSVREYEDLMPFIDLAKSIRSDTKAYMDSPAGIQEAQELALKNAFESERARLTEQFAADIKVLLTEDQKAQIVQDFIDNRQSTVEAEIIAELQTDEDYIRRTTTNRIESMFRQKKREELLAMIDSDESKSTLQKLGEQAIESANRELLYTKLKDKAKRLECFDLLDLPVDTAFSIGLNSPTETENGHYTGTGRYYLNSCERILRLRVVDPENGILDVLKDSWSNSTDSLKKHISLPDLSEIIIPKREGIEVSRLNLGTTPYFTNSFGDKIEMYELETNSINVGEESII